MQRTAVRSGGDLPIRGARLFSRLALEHDDERVERRITLRDALKALVDHRISGRLPRL